MGNNIVSAVPSISVVSGVLGTCLNSAIHSRSWPPVQLKFSADVVYWDIEIWVGCIEEAVVSALGNINWLWAVFDLGALELAWHQVKQKSSAEIVN